MTGTTAIRPSGLAAHPTTMLARPADRRVFGARPATTPRRPRWREDLRLFAMTYAAGFAVFLTLLG